MIKETKNEWTRGDKALLASRAGISPQYLNDILKARKGCSAGMAITLSRACRKLGYDITPLEWAIPAARLDNPLFD